MADIIGKLRQAQLMIERAINESSGGRRAMAKDTIKKTIVILGNVEEELPRN